MQGWQASPSDGWTAAGGRHQAGGAGICRCIGGLWQTCHCSLPETPWTPARLSASFWLSHREEGEAGLLDLGALGLCFRMQS